MSRRILVLLFVCLTPLALRATVIAPAEFREIVNGADVIAYGVVTDTTAEAGDDRKRIETIVTMRVGTYLKGGPGETLVFRVPGGQIGRYRSVMVGAPRFAPGDEVVVFLHEQGSEYPTVFGLTQGVFRVRREARTMRRVVVPPVMARTSGPEPVVRGSAARRPVALETFGAQVQTVLAESAGRDAR